MNIFITGRNGFIAQNLHASLENDGYNISTSSKLDDITIKLKESRPDIIIHLATENAKHNPDKMIESNILLTHKILEYCRYNAVKKLLVFGSSSEYGRKTHPLTETDLLEPETIYEGTKACASILARVYAYSYNIPTIVVRPMSVYGPHDKEYMFISRLFNKNIEFLNNGLHDWTYIDDVVEATIRIMNHRDTDIFDIVNIGIGVQRTNKEVVEIVEKLMNTKIDYTIADGKVYDSMNWVCDPSHLKTKYGYECKTTLEEGLKKYYDWFKNSLMLSQT
jgi:UDP-glucuronate 4-epimerase